MRFTNNHGIPDIIIRAAAKQNSFYDRGAVHRSVTQLIQPPRIDILRKKHFHEMEKDISDEWWALFGSAAHSILQLGASNNQITEERFFAHIDGWEISGACDLQTIHGDNTVSLLDHKITTAFVVMKDEDGVKPEWEQQLNMLAYLIRMNKTVVIRDLSILAIVRDWQRKQAQTDPFYPVAPVIQIKMPVWPFKQQEEFIHERVRLHRNAEMLDDIGEHLPKCTGEERWQHDNTWAVKKNQNKKATKVFDTESEAIVFATERTRGKDHYNVEFRPGKCVRCEGNYCGVAQWCDQFMRELIERSDNKQYEEPDEQSEIRSDHRADASQAE